MKFHPIHHPLRGIIPPMVTPLSAPNQLDRENLPRLLEHLVTGGVHGVFLLGTTGEGPSLSRALQRELITLSCNHLKGRVPILAGITHCAFDESLHLARHAAEAGVHAVVLAPPSYFATSQEEFLGYVKRLAEQSPLPLVLYNMPFHTKTFLEIQTVVRASEIPGIIGFKDSSGDMVYFHKLKSALRERTDFSLLVGPEELLAESVLLGGHGGVNGGANLVPSLYVSLYEAAFKGDLPKIRQLHERVIQISSLLYGIGRSSMAMLRGLKYAMELSGLCRATLSEPFEGFSDKEADVLRRNFETLHLDTSRS